MNNIVVTAALNDESFKALEYFIQEIYISAHMQQLVNIEDIVFHSGTIL